MTKIRLIDADKLKKALRQRQWHIDDIEEVEKIIDNAPTVESNYTAFAEWVTKMIFDDNIEDDCFCELACRKLTELGLVEKTDSEWKMGGEENETNN